ncbi:hypothetical protein [Bacillus sp. ISL-7]|uniref:hypothetical protein n=1 Tax=Bacillus sp. ISL-7 TaxID=2819136 RepID=UPI001BE8BDDC|nr:hypothetical protein [Bacillus sp. ISL-7]MBT2734963.1 hypothetical protein [Bacillus sp. ISL-7]
MKYTHQEMDAFYKKLEKKWNEEIHARTNKRSFTLAFGKALEVHVKQIRIHKRLTTRWLKHLDLPNKDEISAISVRIVDYEEKLDFFDDAIYEIKQSQLKNNTQLRMVRKSCEDLLSVLEMEVKDIHDCKIKSLESELLELKQFFITNHLNLEENNNDEKN